MDHYLVGLLVQRSLVLSVLFSFPDECNYFLVGIRYATLIILIPESSYYRKCAGPRCNLTAAPEDHPHAVGHVSVHLPGIFTMPVIPH